MGDVDFLLGLGVVVICTQMNAEVGVSEAMSVSELAFPKGTQMNADGGGAIDLRKISESFTNQLTTLLSLK